MVAGAGMTFAVRTLLSAIKKWNYIGATLTTGTTVSFPASPTPGNLAVLVGSAASAASTPSGWTTLASGAPFHFYKICDGSESSVTLSVSGVYVLMLFSAQGGLAYWSSGTTTTAAGTTTMTAPDTASLLIAAPSVSVPDVLSWTYTLPTTNAGNIDSVGNHIVVAATTAQPQIAAVAGSLTPGASTGGMNVQYGSYTHRRTYAIFGIA